MELNKNDRVRLTVDGQTLQGQGVAHVDTLAVFVPAAAVGDVLDVQIVKRAKTHAFARIVEIREPSPHRIPNDCPAYPRCGGCVFRHLSYAEELRVKRQAVVDALQRLAGLTPRVHSILPAPATERYRNKAQFPLANTPDGVVAGFYGARSHRVIPCADCRLQPPEFAPLLQTLLEHANEHHILAYDERDRTGLLRHLFLRKSAATGQTQVCLVATDWRIPQMDALAEKLRAAAELSGILLNRNRRDTNVILGEKCRTHWGEGLLTDTLGGLSLSLSPLSFYQVNHLQATHLYALATQAAALTGAETVLELYCGTGVLGLGMARHCARLIGADIVPAAIENARANAARADIRNAEFLCADATAAAANIERADVVLLDPPRGGCGADLVRTVSGLSPVRVVYVSCDAATFARDCAFFCDAGYTLRSVTPVDMFPRTGHVEMVGVLEKTTSR
ncbi:MAG: 23S rRNA (uracil(1939)-C(5))-methyltransferase RlmD [Oscillospiraceae bacterium]|jgi:23S rRNA (uracil1939-C5)-methyltransferase|nr:23S rRNA (uracil(1939)-C(5))-methyltransferase RlmD [Oscillospiraceae bacterium]